MKQNRYEDLLPLPGDASYAFSEFEQLLVSNSGEDAFDVAVQLLTAKLFDERDSAGRTERFTLAGSPHEVHERINGLYKRAVKAWPDLGTTKQSIDISPEQLARCLRPLVGWRILDSDLSHMDAALERLVARDAKGSLGQYFTPRDVIRMCVVALSPRSSDRIIDPACGSGAFLYEAIKHAREHGEDSPWCLGIDLGQRSVRVARLISHAVDPAAMRIHRGNSIDGRAYTDSPPQEWLPFLHATQPSITDRRPWHSWHELTCDLLLTNPPFAGEIDDPGVIAVYDSQRSRGAFRKGSVGREHLFVERAVQILAPGGRLAIVVPQGILANSTSSYLRKWVMERCRILAVVGLHPFSFLPYTGVKTSVLFLEKLQPDSDPGDYPIAFVTSHNSGKDSSGRIVAKSDYPVIGADLSAFFVKEKRAWANNGSPHVKSGVETVRASEVASHDRLDAEYYAHDIRSLYFALQSKSSGCIGDRVARNVERFSKTRSSEIDYIDISSVDSRSGVALPSRMDAAEAPSRASYVVQSGDVLVSTVRPDRNVVALVTKTGDVPVIASNGFCLLRAEGIAPELVFAFCKTEAFRRLLSRRATASMYPAASDRDVLEMPFVDASEEAKDSIVAKVRNGLAMMEAARASISSAVTEMETAIDAAKRAELVPDAGADSRVKNGISSTRRRRRQVEDRNQAKLAILQS
jgi:type I restriction-modification system DNA methylase subunit